MGTNVSDAVYNQLVLPTLRKGIYERRHSWEMAARKY